MAAKDFVTLLSRKRIGETVHSLCGRIICFLVAVSRNLGYTEIIQNTWRKVGAYMLIDDHYSLEKYDKTTKSTCTDVSAEQLSELLLKIPHDMFFDIGLFHSGTYRSDLSDLTKAHWEKIRYLHIQGSADLYTSRSLVKNSIRPGAYLNKSGDYLLLVNVNENKIQPFLDRYGARIAHFSLCQTKLPSLTLNMMLSLETLNLHGNILMTQVEGLEKLEKLNQINIFQCDSLTTLKGLEHLTNLSNLDIRDCQGINTLPEPLHLFALKTMGIASCGGLTTLPSLKGLTDLTTLNLCWCEKLTETPDLSSLVNLTSLYLSYCDSLPKLTVENNVPSLTYLEIHDCKKLTMMPEWERFPNLIQLNLSQNNQLTALSRVNDLARLTSLDLSFCHNLTELSDVQHLVYLTDLNLDMCTNLNALDVTGCKRLAGINGLNTLCGLTKLNFSECDNLTSLDLYMPNAVSKLTELILSKCDALHRLSCSNMNNLTALVGLEDLKHLNKLQLFNCISLSELTGLNGLTQLMDVNLAGCINLKLLDLSRCSNLTSLTGLERLYQLTKLNLSECENLPCLYFDILESDKLPEADSASQSHLIELNLSDCNSLRELTCSNLRRLTKLVGLKSLSALKDLTLINADKIAILPGLDNLTQLTGLNLISCISLKGLPELGNLVQLRELNLSECSNLTELSELSNLGQLMRLNLSGCVNLFTLPDLSNLVQLTTLIFAGCNNLASLPGLEYLARLSTLNLSGCSKLTDLPDLGNLRQLTDLNLSGCGNLTTLFGLDNLSKLRFLRLSGCGNLSKFPELGCLSRLCTLDLSHCSSLCELPSLEALTELTELNLSGCKKLTELSNLTGLSQLRNLDLSGSGITQIPDDICKLQNLEYLDLSDLHLVELPDWLPNIAASFVVDKKNYRRRDIRQCEVRKVDVILQNTSVEGVDMSIFLQSRYMIDSWFQAQRVPLNEIKVVFLGDGEAGKTHTIARLLNDGGYPKDFDDRSTPGIVIKNKDYDLGGHKIQVHYWDFGGQEILHSMHRIFLTNRTMYVILLNARDDTQSDRARYWLHNVKSFAPGAPVLLVLNKIDQNPKASVNEQDLRSRYDKLTKVIRLSARDYTPEQFNREFTNILLEEIQNTGFLSASWPIPWTKVKTQLEQMKGHYIMGDAYQTICKECAVKSHRKKLLHWFNDLGVSFCFCDEEDYALKDYVILRPDWITNALYIILFNECEGAVNGMLPHKAIYELLTRVGSDPSIRCVLPTARYTTSDIHYVLGVMRKFCISFPYGTHHEFIPMLCQQNSKIDTKNYRTDSNILEFSMEFDYLPNNLLHRLMVERNQELDMANVWRTGARFQKEELGFSAVVIIDSNTLRFFIFHANKMHRPNTYLAMLKGNVDRIWRKMGLKEPISQIIYKIDNNTEVFDYKRLVTMLEAGQKKEFSMTWNRLLDISDILNQAAPDGLEEENELLRAIVKSCEQIQREPECRGSKEDNRNRRMRDTLQNFGYDPHDQIQMGTSSSRKGVGELDMMLYRKDKTPWSVIEALRVSDGEKRDWNSHLGKLLDNYNPHGVPYLFLVTYVDCDKVKFDAVWKGYQNHIRKQHAGKFEHVIGSDQVNLEVAKIHYLNIMRSQYRCGEYVPTVYHIFVQMDPLN